MPAQPTIDAALCQYNRLPFTNDEDTQIKDWVAKHGTAYWVELARVMPNRTLRAIRERWINCLAPKIKKCPWTSEEDQMVLDKKKELGPRWTIIAQFLPERTPLNIRNRWHALQKPSEHFDGGLGKDCGIAAVTTAEVEPFQFSDSPFDDDAFWGFNTYSS
jgi:hypothetical protein